MKNELIKKALPDKSGNVLLKQLNLISKKTILFLIFSFFLFNLTFQTRAQVTADFTWTPVNPVILSPVCFKDLSTGSPPPNSWLWDFYDGEIGTTQNPAHIYVFPLPYQVTLFVSNGIDTSSITKLISVDSICSVPGFCTCKALIKGKIYSDLDSNCIFNGSDFPLQNAKTQIQPSPYPYYIYTITDENGNYHAWLDTGIHTVTHILPDTLLWQQLCPDTPDYYTINITNINDTISGLDFANIIKNECQSLWVNIYNSSLRPCKNNFYYVKYGNNGTIQIDNGTLEIELDSNLTYISGNGNLIGQNGNILIFGVDTLLPLEYGSFSFYAYLDCDMSLISSTKCIKAHIYPDSFCLPPDTIWDSSHIVVEGNCVNDSLACFTIYNTGDPGIGDMLGSSEYRIYENQTLVFVDTFQILGGDSLVVCWPTNNNTIRLEADQRPGHPGNSLPRDFVELCGDSTLPFVTWQITPVTQDDADDFIAIECHIVSSSFDPNSKQVKPEGITEIYHYIDSTDVLEYTIYFQNTGTDTADNIVIIDTLSQYLDIITIQPVESSHQYILTILDSNILQWSFDNIILPDSNVNEPESHGFVKYKINQKPGNSIGTLIENKAAIFFDFNPSVITNTVFNTVGNIDSIITNVQKIYYDGISVKVYPNPFSSTTTFEIKGMNEPVTFELYNIIGKQVKAISDITGKKFIISRENLANGIYIYKISSKDKLICAGKLIVN